MRTGLRWVAVGLLLLGPPVGSGACGRPALPWYVTLHGVEIGYDLARADDAFAEAVELGFGGVRTDVFWYDVEPTRGAFDTAKLQFYTSYVSKALAWGLDPLMILSGAPGWAVDLYHSDPAAFWLEYEEYVTEVLLWIGDRVERYQLWNEANHFIDPIPAADDWQLFARAGALVDALDPGATTMVNVMANLPGWEDAVTDWLTRAGDAIDVVGVDHYPGTWACCSYTDWTPLEVLALRIGTPGDPWYGKQGAVLETGFSSWAPLVADEAAQRAWIEQSLPVVRDLVRDHPSIVLGGFYQLIDVDTSGVGQEAHFGILHDDLTAKLGYDALRSELAQF